MNKGITITESDYDDRTLLISGKIDFNYNMRVAKRLIHDAHFNVIKESHERIVCEISHLIIKRANEVSTGNKMDCNKYNELVKDLFDRFINPILPIYCHDRVTCPVCGCVMDNNIKEGDKWMHDKDCVVKRTLDVLGLSERRLK